MHIIRAKLFLFPYELVISYLPQSLSCQFQQEYVRKCELIEAFVGTKDDEIDECLGKEKSISIQNVYNQYSYSYSYSYS